MSSRAFERWVLAAGFAVAAGYGIVAVIEALVSANAAIALPYAYVAVSIAGPLSAVAWLLRAPQRARGDDEPGGGDGPGPPAPDDDPPPWWPGFEREFWAHVRREAAREQVLPAP